MDELIRKALAYLEAGVKACWIVQPALETIAVILPDRKPEVYSSGEVTDPGTGIKVEVEEVFRRFH